MYAAAGDAGAAGTSGAAPWPLGTLIAIDTRRSKWDRALTYTISAYCSESFSAASSNRLCS